MPDPTPTATAPKASPWLLLDWGDTVMRVFPEYPGPMRDWHRVGAMPGVPETLAALAGGVRLALATNAADSDEEAIRGALDRAGLADRFQRIFCYRTVGYRKPSREFFQAVLEELAVPPTGAVMVGDDFDGDVLGANAAGLRAVWLNLDDRTVREGPLHRTIHRFADLPAALGAWGIGG